MIEDSLTANSVETKKDIGLSPKDLIRRWLLEIKLSDKGEEKWRRGAAKVMERYRGTDKRKNSFNILYSNTETLRPAILNSPPKADVRRRYRDEDPLGKAVSDTMTRSLNFSVDSYDLFPTLRMCLQDALLPGRGVCRIRYIPSLEQIGGEAEENEGMPEHEPVQGQQVEELEWEQVVCEHVNWMDFRRGQGRTWGEVQWIAFRHRMTRDQLIEKFGEDIGNKIELTGAQDEDIKNLTEKDPIRELFNTCEVWEVWDKEDRKVIFLSNGYRDGPLDELDDPLGLEQFFPIPRPLQFINDTDKLVPISLFSLYEEQANELDNASYRRNKLIDALKFRGVYDATIKEMAEVLRGNDNDLIPAKGVAAFIERGGLDKMIWVMPIKDAAAVLVQLDQTIAITKQIIYDITGIADIIRASTDPNETLGAQKLKSQWGSMRLQDMQREVQRYSRDLIRLMGEVVGQKFQLETLKVMTGLPYLTEQEWAIQAQKMMAQAQQQYQQALIQAQTHGQPPPQPPQPPQKPILWEDIMQVMRDSGMRQYHIDIETDSTITDQINGDMDGLNDVLTAITSFIQASLPAVQVGMMPVEAVKEVVMTIARRARLGGSVEDAWSKIQQPAPQSPDNGAAIKAQADIAIAREKGQIDLKKHAAEMALKERMDASANESRARADAQSAIVQQQAQAQQRQAELEAEAGVNTLKTQAEYKKAIDVALINAQSAKEVEAMRLQHDAAKHTQTIQAQAMAPKPEPQQDIGGLIQQALAPIHQHLAAMAQKKPEGAREITIVHKDAGSIQ